MTLPAVSNYYAFMDAERFLTNIISAISRSGDFRTSIANLAGLVTDGFADWCGVYMFENEQTVRRLAVAPTPQLEALFPLDLHATIGPAYVRRTGANQLLTNPGAAVAEALGVKPEDLLLPGRHSPSVYLCMPVLAAKRPIGAVVFMCANPKQGFDSRELSLAASVANAVAVAMEHSKLHRDAQEANRLKDEFIAKVSHELKTPLTPLLGCVHLLRTTSPSAPNFNRALEMIERNARMQVDLVEGLLDASRIVAGKLRLSIKSTSIVPIVEAAIETVKSSAEAKAIRIVTNFADVRTPIDGDPYRLQQIVLNLLLNAVKFTPAEGRIEVSVRPDGDAVQVQVTDTGVGIPGDLLPHIFDRFRKDIDGHSNSRSGLGLGLAIARQLAELHNGSIEASSAGPGKGAVFTLRFPFAALRSGTNSGSDI